MANQHNRLLCIHYKNILHGKVSTAHWLETASSLQTEGWERHYLGSVLSLIHAHIKADTDPQEPVLCSPGRRLHQSSEQNGAQESGWEKTELVVTQQLTPLRAWELTSRYDGSAAGETLAPCHRCPGLTAYGQRTWCAGFRGLWAWRCHLSQQFSIKTKWFYSGKNIPPPSKNIYH